MIWFSKTNPFIVELETGWQQVFLTCVCTREGKEACKKRWKQINEYKGGLEYATLKTTLKLRFTSHT